ncbi:MAG TPA: LysM peptidoglycan-binding domain-containing protein [Chitinophagaceae bacterium]|nr:LysM peptidoglycan-binding domain-containing protein [Chitinophagaceae bacterium]
MLKRFLLVILSGLFANMLVAQNGDLMIQGSSPDLYLVHTVAPKENWYSIGRLYNVSPKEFAPYNGFTLDKPLNIGQQIRIPLTSVNFLQNVSATANESLLPVYHVVQEKEWMFRISTNYNKVPVETIEKWNNISKDNAKAGTKLIIGYLKTKKDQSALSSANTQVPAAQPNTPVPAPSTPAPVTASQEKKQEPSIAANPEPAAKPETRQVEAAPVEEKKPVDTKPAARTVAATGTSGGYFESLYEESGKSASGSSGIFKSTSGWQDGKYYALINNVAIGTIVKLSNPANNKFVYAKVLGQLPDMKESAGLTARVSDAAASELGFADTKFRIDVKY